LIAPGGSGGEEKPILTIGIPPLERNYLLKNVWDESGAFQGGFKDMMKGSIETYLNMSLVTFDRCFTMLQKKPIAMHPKSQTPQTPQPTNLHISLKYFNKHQVHQKTLEKVAEEDVTDINNYSTILFQIDTAIPEKYPLKCPPKNT
jgi:hypothetical protein